MWDQCATRSRAGHCAMLLNSESVKASLDQDVFNKEIKTVKEQFGHEINPSSLSHFRALCHRHHPAETQPGASQHEAKRFSIRLERFKFLIALRLILIFAHRRSWAILHVATVGPGSSLQMWETQCRRGKKERRTNSKSLWSSYSLRMSKLIWENWPFKHGSMGWAGSTGSLWLGVRSSTGFGCQMPLRAQTDGSFAINTEKKSFWLISELYVFFFCNLTFFGAVTTAGLQREPQRPAIMTFGTQKTSLAPDFILKIYFNTTAAYKY